MTTQIAVRLPDDLVQFLDAKIAEGVSPSRAAIVAEALEAQRRRQAALEDARILEEVGTADDLDDLVTWTAQQTVVED